MIKCTWNGILFNLPRVIRAKRIKGYSGESLDRCIANTIRHEYTDYDSLQRGSEKNDNIIGFYESVHDTVAALAGPYVGVIKASRKYADKRIEDALHQQRKVKGQVEMELNASFKGSIDELKEELISMLNSKAPAGPAKIELPAGLRDFPNASKVSSDPTWDTWDTNESGTFGKSYDGSPTATLSNGITYMTRLHTREEVSARNTVFLAVNNKTGRVLLSLHPSLNTYRKSFR